MRVDHATGKMVPSTLSELLSYLRGEVDPKLLGPEGRKDDVIQAVEAMIQHEGGGAKINPELTHERLMAFLVVKSASYARSRVRQSQEALEPNDATMEAAGQVVRSGDRQLMLKFAAELDKAARHPAVHPDKRPGLERLSDWVRMNARRN